MAEYISNGESASAVRQKMNEGLITPATFEFSGGMVKLTAPENAKHIEFVTTRDYSSSETVQLNGSTITLKNAIDASQPVFWKNGAVVSMTVIDNIGYVTTLFDLNKYLPISGGSVTGNVSISGQLDMKNNRVANIANPALGNDAVNYSTAKLIANSSWKKILDKTTAGAFEWTAPDLFGGKPYLIGCLLIGGGGSGGAAADRAGSNSSAKATGGASGYAISFLKKVTPNQRINGVVGAGGTSSSASTEFPNNTDEGKNGGTTSFDGITVSGGEGGRSSISTSSYDELQYSKGGQPTSFFYDGYYKGLYGGEFPLLDGVSQAMSPESLYELKLQQCFNPFEQCQILGSGSSAESKTTSSSATSSGTVEANKNPVTKIGGGNSQGLSSDSSVVNAVGENAGEPGCGGGAATAIGSSGSTAKSGAGKDGAVYIYVQGDLL